MSRTRVALLAALALTLSPSPGSARPLLRQETVATLARRIQRERDRVDPQVFAQLAAIGDLDALEALERAVGQLKKLESIGPAYLAFAGWSQREGELADRARRFLARAAFKARPREAQAEAVRAIRRFRDPALPALERVLADHKDPACRTLACDALVPRLATIEEEGALALLLANASLSTEVGLPYVSAIGSQQASFEGLPHREVVRTLLASRTDEATTAAVAAQLANRETSRAWKFFCIELLAAREGADATAGLAAAFADPEVGVVLEALERVVDRPGSVGIADQLRPLVRSKEAAVRRAAVAAMGKLELTDAKVRAELTELARCRDAATRMGAAAALFEVRTLEAIDALHTLLTDKEWTVRSEAIDQLTKLRQLESIPHLIGRLSEETGRLREDSYGALRVITGLDLGRRDANWLQWWEREGGTFVVPTADAVRQIERDRAARLDRGRTAATSIYGVHVVSERVCFVLDVSGSMRLNSGTGVDPTQPPDPAKPSRMDFAKEELAGIVRHFPDGKLFNLIFFESEVRALNDGLVKMNRSNRQRSQRFIRDQYALGGTALYPALQLAFRDPLVDTIYLISDGAPTEGEITEIEQIRAEVRRWNGPRRVKIHGITIGQDSTLLRWLTADTGGTYTRRD